MSIVIKFVVIKKLWWLKLSSISNFRREICMEQKQHHYFFAVKLPNETKTFLADWVEKNKETFPFQRWVHPEDYHITLAFLGFAEKDKLDAVKKQIKKVLNNQQAFSLTLHNAGTFGQKENPRIFWADTFPSEELSNLQKKVYNQVIDSGFVLDKKPFRPHITLARKWNDKNPFNPSRLGEILRTTGDTFSFNINEVVLYETHLDKNPKYKIVDLYRLT